jgi:hypothetical protein
MLCDVLTIISVEGAGVQMSQVGPLSQRPYHRSSFDEALSVGRPLTGAVDISLMKLQMQCDHWPEMETMDTMFNKWHHG